MSKRIKSEERGECSKCGRLRALHRNNEGCRPLCTACRGTFTSRAEDERQAKLRADRELLKPLDEVVRRNWGRFHVERSGV